MAWLAIIVVSAIAIEGYVKVKRMQIKHTERMAKIQQGIDPGDETEAYRKDELWSSSQTRQRITRFDQAHSFHSV